MKYTVNNALLIVMFQSIRLFLKSHIEAENIILWNHVFKLDRYASFISVNIFGKLVNEGQDF